MKAMIILPAETVRSLWLHLDSKLL